MSIFPLTSGTGSPEMKTVSYRGIVEFCIPASWTEEYSDNGDGTYYEANKPGTCVLTLSIQTFMAPPGQKLTPVGILQMVKPQERVNPLPNGNAIAHFERTVTDDGDQFQRSVWVVAGLTSSGIIRIATFIHTIAKFRERDPGLMRMRTLVEGEIRKARFAENLAEGEA